MALSPVRILYAEDTPATARLLQRRLQRAGYEVVVVHDGLETLAAYESGSYDLLALDHEIPVMTGLEVIRTLAGKGPLPPTIMITGAGNEAIAVEAMKLGADDYIIKDSAACYVDLLPQRIEQALAKKRLVEDKRAAEQALRKAHDELEERVRLRTAELVDANERLKKEISERQKAEESLRESEGRFRAIFESAQECIILKDRSLRYRLVNPAAESLLSRQASQIVGLMDEDLFDPATASRLRQKASRSLEGDTVEAELTLVLAAGGRATMLVTVVPLRHGDGSLMGVCCIAHDVTGRKHLTGIVPPAPSDYVSEAMRATLGAAEIAAQSDIVVLLTGESGTGKDYLARYIHEHSARSSGPFHAINCAAIPHELAESELFGHERGAFTGAHSAARGMLELAEGGTLLLNEIGELPISLQAKLLSFLDTWTLTRVGGRKAVKVNARLIAATNRNLQEEVLEGRFRPDLFYRLNVLSIRVPPLRDRTEDIPVLVERILERLTTELQLPHEPRLDSRTVEELAHYDWPGNVRELRNVLERALILSKGGRLTVEPCSVGTTVTPSWSFPVDFGSGQTFDSLLRSFARRLLQEALRLSGGNKSRAAHVLGLSRHALRRRMQTVQLGTPSEEGGERDVRMRRT